jgi:transcriptional regulator with XRE-family HTH domain
MMLVVPPTSLTKLAAAELRAHMARNEVRVADLTQKMDVRPGWLYRRLSGEVSLTLEDLELICSALGIPVSALLPVADTEHVA